MLIIEQIQREAYANAVEKGWHKYPLCEIEAADTVGGKAEYHVIHHDRVLAELALVHTELTEAQDCLDYHDLVLRFDDNGKPEGFAAEAADVVIRLGNLCGALAQVDPERFNLRCTDLSGYSHSLVSVDALDRRMLTIRKHVDRATEHARVNNWYDFVFSLNAVVQDIAIVCASVGVDLPGAITAKMAYNKTRSHRHGGKSA